MRATAAQHRISVELAFGGGACTRQIGSSGRRFKKQRVQPVVRAPIFESRRTTQCESFALAS